MSPAPEAINRLLSRIAQFEKLLAIVAFALLVLVVFADVVARELSGAGLYWASRTGVWANVAIVMAGFGLASAQGAHLRPRFADGWLPDSWSRALSFLQHALMALFSLAIGLLAARVVLGSWRLGEVAVDLFLPIWPIQLLLPLAFFVAAVRYSIYAVFPDTRPEDSNAMTMSIESRAE